MNPKVLFAMTIMSLVSILTLLPPSAFAQSRNIQQGSKLSQQSFGGNYSPLLAQARSGSNASANNKRSGSNSSANSQRSGSNSSANSQGNVKRGSGK